MGGTIRGWFVVRIRRDLVPGVGGDGRWGAGFCSGEKLQIPSG